MEDAKNQETEGIIIEFGFENRILRIMAEQSDIISALGKQNAIPYLIATYLKDKTRTKDTHSWGYSKQFFQKLNQIIGTKKFASSDATYRARMKEFERVGLVKSTQIDLTKKDYSLTSKGRQLAEKLLYVFSE